MRCLLPAQAWALAFLTRSTTVLAAANNAPDTFYSDLRPCPAACDSTPGNWTVYSSLQRLGVCTEPMLLDFAIFNALDDPSTTTKLRTCTSGNASDTQNGLLSSSKIVPHKRAIKDTFTDNTCITASESKVDLGLLVNDNQGAAGANNLQDAIQNLKEYMSESTHCRTKFLVGYSQGAIVAVYSGDAIDNGHTVPSVLEQVGNEFHGSSPSSAVVELCGEDRNADYTFGVAIDTTGDMAAVQKAVASWSNGTCFGDGKSQSKLSSVKIFEAPVIHLGHGSSGKRSPSILSHGHSHGHGHAQLHTHEARGNCRTINVVGGDSCGSLASKCGITGSKFSLYNPGKKLCSSLQAGQRVCCTSGTLPDITPKPNKDGSCASYNVKSGDNCALIANKNGITMAKLEKFNDKITWGWGGCKNLAAGINICLSTGSPPLPAPVANAICGPLKPGTSTPKKGQNLADLNPCPLNSCCNIWGQCGITPDYCTAEKGPTGNPGTAPPKKNGCVSNCGTSIKNNSNKPKDFMSIAYYESWNWDRPCLNYRAINLGGTPYSHAHWGFATLDKNYKVVVNDTYKQLSDFLTLPNKKILSFGGWGYSTDPKTYESLRTAMNPGNVDKLVGNIVSYLKKGWDGVDIDWEYPGAPDIPGIPPGLKSDAPNYLAFLKKLRKALGTSKSISIAAPASYWYLKAFPIAEMAKEVDYIVYMTYDLHGQWDYKNQWAQEGCAAGNCLRSHVNLTETTYALAMITKAGVPASKINVGVSSYGRSFGLTNRAACEKSLSNSGCHMMGPNSGATPGNCTHTAGYISNAEIEEIMNLNTTGAGLKYAYDQSSASDTLFYGNNWVAYMSDVTKKSRISHYEGLNFAGTVDWAVDLQQYTDDDLDPSGNDDLPDTSPLADCSANYSTFDELDAHASSIPQHCISQYTVQTLKALLSETLSNYTSWMNNGYDKKFGIYSKAVAGSADQSLLGFINDNGNSYATCIVAETSICCDSCNKNKKSDTYCDYCFSSGKCTQECSAIGCSNDKRDDVRPEPELIVKTVNESEPCPPDYSKRGYGPDNPYEQTVYWTWKNSSGFFADLELNTGIPKSKTKMGSYDFLNGCPPSAKAGDICWSIGMYYNVPIINGYSASDVANPKDVVSKGLAKIKGLPTQLDKVLTDLQLDAYIGDDMDLIDSLSLPILMLASATENMGTVVEIADKITEEERKAFILAFLSAIFLIIPVIGEVVGSVAELADIGTIMALLGAAGNSAVDIYTIVDDPKNAPLAIFDLILAPLAIADIATITKASNLRRGMEDADIAKLGDRVKGRMDTIDKLKGVCKPDLA
ncbi:glycoside hydrolase family 18 protein [Ilyonectria destructans]|nr:glycoside hydrolase family 18 protein [Ilyonectria destructans]